MSKNELNKEQKAAVENRGGPLLVSAAAGSGKTRVLVERLLDRVISSGGACDVDDFLVITFTNAAAAELRGRILGEISERLAVDPGNKHLRRQADLCCRAHIETIHSFCTGVIRENAHIAGVNPEFRIADDAEALTLRLEVIEDLFEDLYDGQNEDFLALADTMGAGLDDSGLIDIVLKVYNRIMCNPYPEKWLDSQLDALDLEGITDAAETVWGEYILKKCVKKARYLAKETASLIEDSASLDEFARKYGPSLESTYESLTNFISAAESGWDSARNASEFNYKTTAKTSRDLFVEEKARRSAIIDELKKLTEVFHDDSDKLISDMKAVSPQIRALFNVVKEFSVRYGEKKRKRGIIDFSDQEHLALSILIDSETGEATETAKELSKRFTEIMVDEYQDVNAVQELIFSAVSRGGNNIFMVGDVKQSIYRFRLADPGIFLGKYEAYKDRESAADGEGRKIVLSKNYRSRKGVLDAVNFFFTNIMSKEFGEMDYGEDEALYFGADYYPETDEPSFELDVVNMNGMADDDEDSGNKTAAEARAIAGRIRELIASGKVSDGAGGMRRVRYGDIAVLLRSAHGKLPEYTAVLASEGIPTVSDGGEDFFSSIEISLTVSLLTVIDNPHQDVPLISVLRSPIFGVTADELAALRAEFRTGDIYTAVCAGAEKNEKLRYFIDTLNDLRRAAPDKNAGELLSYIAEKTALFAVISAMPGGARRRDNLMKLFDYAKRFEATNFKGLFGFVLYLRQLSEKGDSGADKASFADVDAVRIMTIHKSKGMEFPVVILADTAKKFNTEDSKDALLLNGEFGIGAKYVDTGRRISYPTLARSAIVKRTLEESRAEELRVLYVAMTRAQEKLIIFMTFADAEKSVTALAGSPLPVPPEKLDRMDSPAKWILLPALRREECVPVLFGAPIVPVDTDGEKWAVRLIDAAEKDHAAESETAEEVTGEKSVDYGEIAEKLSYVYPYSSVTSIPSKLTATELNGGAKEAESAENADEIVKKTAGSPKKPAFMEKAGKMTAAERGIAAHTVMQYADFAKCVTADGAAGEIARLREMKIISPEQADAVDPRVISTFMNSEIGKRVLAADKVRREFKFSILADSETLGYPAGEEILLQGVIDCCIEESGSLTVIDYKTDHVTPDTVDEKVAYYTGQLTAYADALEKMMKKPVREKKLYFLSAGICADIKS